MKFNQKINEIRTSQQLFCYLCGSKSKMLYQGLTDRLFSAHGEWNLKQCSNPECGLLWLDPMPTREDISKAYQNYYTHGNVNNVPTSGTRRLMSWIEKGYLVNKYKYRLEKVTILQKIFGLLICLDLGWKSEVDFQVMYLKSQFKRRLLDVGCGSGKFLILMRDLGWQVQGTEVDLEAVEVAKSNGLRVNLGELADQKYPDNHFDAITLNNVIEHIHHPLDILFECRRILKDRGTLIIITPNAKSRIHNIYKENWFSLDPPRHLYIFSSSNLKLLAQKAGFKNIDTWTTSRNLRSTLIGSWDIKRKGSHKMGGYQPLSRRLLAKFLQFFEEIILKIRTCKLRLQNLDSLRNKTYNLEIKSDIGDEVVLKVQK